MVLELKSISKNSFDCYEIFWIELVRIVLV